MRSGNAFERQSSMTTPSEGGTKLSSFRKVRVQKTESNIVLNLSPENSQNGKFSYGYASSPRKVASSNLSSLVISNRYDITILPHKISIHSFMNCGATCPWMIKPECVIFLVPWNGALILRRAFNQRNPINLLKPATDGRWAHLACVIWIPETCLSDIMKMEPIDELSRINKDRWKLLCGICGVSYGAYYRPPSNPSGCARSEPYNYFGRKGSMEPEALAVLKTYQLDASKSIIFMAEKYKYMRETLERDWHLRLAELGFNYGDMPTHNLLWREYEKSSHNVAAPIAMCPTGTTASTLRPDTTASGTAEFRSAFDVLDVDNDGKISRDDLRNFYSGFSAGGGEAAA
ncbi:hypothetical protein TEA_016885 [Camellia sinensis var. sinensis]|uniref:EF-hand domain-containing protein n=1 Tax=Camellia sinensis var. sinensis TaxID=542762 RepID=A0A4S4DDV0_CAMSN|nr:hypothetical protein TEA_016885 [Camellia sinensis var. sinensis]